jgi:hypothetical protein
LDTRSNQVLTLGNLSLGLNLNKPDSQFGNALAAGDLNADGFTDLIVGIPFWDHPTTGNDAGAVAVFFGGGTGFVDQQGTFLTEDISWVPGTSRPSNRFGSALAVADFNRDGVDDVAIGIPLEDIGTQLDAGSVVVLYGHPAGGFSTEADLLRDKFVASGDAFGLTLSAGDFDGNGDPDLAIGHPFEDASAENSGAVTIFYGNGSASGFVARHQYWAADVFNLPGDPERNDRFGSSLAAADFDGNGADELAIGSPFETQERFLRSDRISTGRVTVLYGTTRGLTVTSRSDWHQAHLPPNLIPQIP